MRAARVTAGPGVAGTAPPRPVPLVLVAHGSRDARARAATEALAVAVRAARPDLRVDTAFLDHTEPAPGPALAAVQSAGHAAAIVVPLLLTSAYHDRVDVPDAVAAARAAGLRIGVRVADVIGPVGGIVDPLLRDGLRRRLSEAEPGDVDAVVLAAAGTRDAAARRTVDLAAADLGAALGVPCVPAYASAAPPTPGAAVSALRAGGARRVAVAAYFLAPGRLYESAVADALDAGAVAVAEPLGDAEEIAELVLRRATAAANGASATG